MIPPHPFPSRPSLPTLTMCSSNHSRIHIGAAFLLLGATPCHVWQPTCPVKNGGLACATQGVSCAKEPAGKGPAGCQRQRVTCSEIEAAGGSAPPPPRWHRHSSSPPNGPPVRRSKLSAPSAARVCDLQAAASKWALSCCARPARPGGRSSGEAAVGAIQRSRAPAALGGLAARGR